MYSLLSGELSNRTKEIFLAYRFHYVSSYVKDFLDKIESVRFMQKYMDNRPQIWIEPKDGSESNLTLSTFAAESYTVRMLSKIVNSEYLKGYNV